MSRINQYFGNNKLFKILINRQIYISVYILSCILWFFPILGIFMNPICKVCFLWGVFLIIYDFLVDRKILDTTYWYWLIALVGVYCITILINIHSNFYMGIKHLIYTSIVLLIVFSQNGHSRTKNVKELIIFIDNNIIITTFLASIISLVMYCFHVGLRFEQNGTIFRQGFLENRLFGVYGSPNIGALFSVIAVAVMCLNSCFNNGKLFKWSKFYIINGILQLFYFSLTLSNGGFLTAVTFIGLFVCIFLFVELKKRKNLLLSVVLSVFIILGASIGLLVAMNGIRMIVSVVPSSVQYLISLLSDGENDENTKIVFERIESGDDKSNGRLTIWSGGIKLWKQSPLFGIADARVDKENLQKSQYSFDEMTEEEIDRLDRADGNLHNAYVQVLVNSGLVGSFCFIFLIALIVMKYSKYLISEDTQTDSYKVIGILFCMLGAIGANGMVENHLLYNRQDPYGVIFWFYLGCGLILIRKYTSEKRYKDYACRKQEEKFLFACDTPLQIFNTINFVENDMMGSKGKADIYIVHQFNNSEEISMRIKKQGIFCHVYDGKPFLKKKGLQNKFLTLKRVYFPKKEIEKYLTDKSLSIQHNYRYYFLSFQTPTTICLQLANPNAENYLMEDGLGSYIGNIEEDYTSTLYKIINKYFLENRISLNPIAIFLNNPQMCNSKLNCKFHELPKLGKNNDTIKKLEYVYSYSKEKRTCLTRYIYLTQPLVETKGYIQGAETRQLDVLKKYIEKENIEVRVHPRQKEYDADGLTACFQNQMWELECLYKIRDEQVLISAFSTTLFMPKIINNAEPTLIFTYKLLFEHTDRKEWREKEKFILDFANFYTSKMKIFIPETIEELETILCKIDNDIRKTDIILAEGEAKQ